MVKEWISPVIEIQTNALVDKFTLSNEQDQCYNVLSNFIRNLNISTEETFELDNIIIEYTTEIVRHSYTKGLFDGAKYLK